MIHFATFESKFKPEAGKLYIKPPFDCVHEFFNSHTEKADNLDKKKRDHEGFSLCHFINRDGDKVSRSSDNVSGAYGIVFDIDCEADKPIYTVDEASELFKDYMNVIYTTYSNTSELPRFRIVLFFDSMVAKEEWTYAYNYLRNMLPKDAPVDNQSSVMAQQWFMPELSKSHKDAAVLKKNRGELLNLKEVLKAGLEDEKSLNKKGDQTTTFTREAHTSRHLMHNSTEKSNVNRNLHNSVNSLLTTAQDYQSNVKESTYDRVIKVLEEPAMHPMYFCGATYNLWIAIGSAIKGEGMPYEVFRDWSAKDPNKFNERDCYKTWQSFNGASGAGTIFNIAKDQGVIDRCGLASERRYPSNVVTMPGVTRAATPPDEVEEEFVPRHDEPNDKGNFPIHLAESAPENIARYMEYVLESTDAPNPIFALAAGISCMGALYHQRIKSSYKSCATNMYILSIGYSGQGKGHAYKCTRTLFNALEKDYLIQRLPQSQQGLLTLLHENMGNLYLNVDEFEQKFLKPLASKSTAQYFDQLSTEFLEIYSEPHLPHKGPGAVKDKEKNHKNMISSPHLSMYGLCVDDLFYKHYNGDLATGGLLARIMPFGNVDFLPPERENFKDVDEIPEKLIKFCKSILDMPVNYDSMTSYKINPKVINWADSNVRNIARQHRRYWLEKSTEMSKNDQRKIGAIYSRLCENALKIALAAHEGDVISLPIWEWSMQVSEALSHNIIHNAITGKPENKFDDLVNKMDKIIASKRGWIDAEEITSKFRHNKVTREEVLDDMIMTRKIKHRQLTPLKGGRPRNQYHAIQSKYY